MNCIYKIKFTVKKTFEYEKIIFGVDCDEMDSDVFFDLLKSELSDFVKVPIEDIEINDVSIFDKNAIIMSSKSGYDLFSIDFSDDDIEIVGDWVVDEN